MLVYGREFVPAYPEVLLWPTEVPPNWEPMLLRASLSMFSQAGQYRLMVVSLVMWEVDDRLDVLLLVIYGGPPSLEMRPRYILCHHSHRPLHCHNSRRVGSLIRMAMLEKTTHIRIS
jgi:hypothetical protein